MNRLFLQILFFFLTVNCLFATSDSGTKVFAGEETSMYSLALLSDSLDITIDTAFIQTSDCLGEASLCIDIPLEDISNYEITDNGIPYSGTFQGCDFDTISAYTYTTLFGQGALGPYMIDSWEVNGMIFTGVFQDIPELVGLMNGWDPTGNWVLDADALLISGGDPANVYSNIDVTVISINTPSFIGYNIGLEAMGVSLEFPVGIHEVVVYDMPNDCYDTVFVTTACIVPETIINNLALDDVTVECLDFTELMSAPVSVENVCPELGGTNAEYNLINGETCVEITALTVGVDTACIVACDEMGLCDTTYYITIVSSMGGNMFEFYDSLLVGSTDVFCVDTTGLAGNVVSINNICPTTGSGSAVFTIDPMTYCVTYDGVLEGDATACIEVCDDQMICDTTFMYINVDQPVLPDTVSQTIAVNTSDTYCVDQTELNGTIVSIVNGCPGSSGEYVDFSVDNMTYCVDFMGIDIGQDTACIYLIDDTGAIDTTIVIIRVVPPIPETIVDTLILGEDMVYCIDTTELGGNVVGAVNFCPDLSGNIVNFDVNNVTLCVEATSLAIGTDSACIEICDEFAVCDTTYFQITVIEPDSNSPPTVNPDIDTTSQNTATVINVCGNDILPGLNFTEFFILPTTDGGAGPLYGTVNVNNDCTIEYIPDADFCGDFDNFNYVVCNTAGCDTTLVDVYVSCGTASGDFEIYDGFSPNNDGTNDVFFINGLDNFPNNSLCIFNRWGNRVLLAEPYQNNWEGTWEGTDLPDGTYFYVFDDGEGNITTGYVQIHR